MECEGKNNHREDTTFLERSRSVKVQVEALGALLGPEDVEVDLGESCKKQETSKGAGSSKTFSSNDMSFLETDWSRWDKYKRAPWRQDPSASARDGWWQASLGQPQEQLIVGWSQDEKKGDRRSGRLF